MKHRWYLGMSGSCLLTAFLLCMVYLHQGEETLASHIAPKVIRFHVLANSDTAADQSLKLSVKELLLRRVYDGLGEDATREETCSYITAHREELEQAAEEYMAGEGYHYQAAVELKERYFPTKRYGDVVFPCGLYEAVQVTLGEGKGKNWWCVLYPPLCFVTPTYAVVPEESKDQLKALLPEDDFQDLMADRRLEWSVPSGAQGENAYDVYPDGDGVKADIQIKFKLLEILKP